MTKICRVCGLPINCSGHNTKFPNICYKKDIGCVCDICYIRTSRNFELSLERVKNCHGLLYNKSVEEAKKIIDSFIIAGIL